MSWMHIPLGHIIWILCTSGLFPHYLEAKHVSVFHSFVELTDLRTAHTHTQWPPLPLPHPPLPPLVSLLHFKCLCWNDMSKLTIFCVMKITFVSSIWGLCKNESAEFRLHPRKEGARTEPLWWGIRTPLRYHFKNRENRHLFLVRGPLLILINDVLVK